MKKKINLLTFQSKNLKNDPKTEVKNDGSDITILHKLIKIETLFILMELLNRSSLYVIHSLTEITEYTNKYSQEQWT